MTGHRLRDTLLVVILTFPILGTFFPVEGYFSSTSSFAATNTGSSTISTYIVATLLAAALLIILRRPGLALVAFRQNWLLVAFILWCLISAAWSPDPAFSINRTLRLGLFAGVALYMIHALGLEKSACLLLAAIALSQLLSALAIIAFPNFAVAADARGAWRGALPHKNALGALSAIAILGSFIAWNTRAAKPLACLALTILSSVLLALANSVAALAALAVGLTITLVAMLSAKSSPTHRGFTLLLLAAAAALLTVAAPIIETALYEIIGRDPTLTGRSEIWAFVTDMIEQHPIWGYGHGIWNDLVFRERTLAYLGWPSPHAHNLWLDLRLQLGWPGLMLLATIMAIAVYQSIYLLLFRPTGPHLIAITILAVMLTRSYAETLIIEPDLGGAFWLAFATAGIGHAWRETQRQRQSAAAVIVARPANADYWGP